jgi:hypothetical protein
VGIQLKGRGLGKKWVVLAAMWLALGREWGYLGMF